MEMSEIESRLDAVLSTASQWLPEEQLSDMRSLVAAGEPGIALENFCTQLLEFEVAVPPEMVAELKLIATAMGMTVRDLGELV